MAKPRLRGIFITFSDFLDECTWSADGCSIRLFFRLYHSVYANTHPPLIHLNPFYINGLNYINILGIMFSIAWVAYFYTFVVERVESRLEHEPHRTAQVLDRLETDLADAASYVHSALPSPITTGPIRNVEPKSGSDGA